MRIAIVDDDRVQQQALYQAVSQWAQQIHEAVNFFSYKCAEDFIEALNSNQFDIVFLDIYMKELTGIDAAKALRTKTLDTLIIFLTTSQEHMIQAFPCHAFDYMIKPIEKERLYKTLNEALKVIPQNKPYIDIVCSKQKLSFFLSDILYILSDSNYCIVGLNSKQYRTRISFSEFAEKLSDAKEFITISRGIMVNLDNVICVEKSDCKMINNEVFPISRRKKDFVEQSLIDRRFEKRRNKGV